MVLLTPSVLSAADKAGASLHGLLDTLMPALVSTLASPHTVVRTAALRLLCVLPQVPFLVCGGVSVLT